MKVQYPDYSRSLVSMLNSVLKYFGAETSHSTLQELDAALADKPEKVVVMLFDGLGTAMMERHLPADSFLRSHLACPVSSVFPPTTVAATMSVLTGLTPAEHGRLGWWLYFKEVDDNVSAFGNMLQKTDKPAGDRRLMDVYMPIKPVWERIREADPSVRTAYVSPFGDYKTRSSAHACRTVRKLARGKGKCYIYSYRPLPDSLIHAFGTSSRKVSSNIRMIDRQVKRMSRRLKNALIVVTADHGLVDVEYLHFQDYPELNDMLLRIPSVEGRAASIFVKEGMREQFREKFNEQLGRDFLLLSKEEVYAQKLFGPGIPHERTDGFIGDFMAIATGNKFITSLTGKELKAHHAGMTDEEMNVPLIIIRT